MTRLDVKTTAVAAAVTVPATDRRCKLLCKPDPHWRFRPLTQRSMDLVKPELRRLLWNLVTGKSQWPLYLHGGAGRGKTFAMLALLDSLSFARFWTVDDLMDRAPMGSAPWQVTWGLSGGPHLAVLDELGLPRSSDKAANYDYDVVKQFCDWREHRPAIYIGNHPPGNLAGLYDDRIQSRLTCGTVFELVDVDRRKDVLG